MPHSDSEPEALAMADYAGGAVLTSVLPGCAGGRSRSCDSPCADERGAGLSCGATRTPSAAAGTSGTFAQLFALPGSMCSLVPDTLARSTQQNPLVALLGRKLSRRPAPRAGNGSDYEDREANSEDMRAVRSGCSISSARSGRSGRNVAGAASGWGAAPLPPGAETVSFALSDDTEDFVPLPWMRARIEAATQTEEGGRAERRTCGVNTLASWQGQDGTRISGTCGKPPQLPGGPSPRACSRPGRQPCRRPSRNHSPQAPEPPADAQDSDLTYTSSSLPSYPQLGRGEFDGSWVLSHDCPEEVSPWLRALDIVGDRACDAIGQCCRLTTEECGERTQTLLEGGQIFLVSDVLHRTGRSGVTLKFVRREGCIGNLMSLAACSSSAAEENDMVRIASRASCAHCYTKEDH